MPQPEEMAALLDSAASMLPDHERPPSRDESEMAALVAVHAREAAEFRSAMDGRLESIRRMERTTWLLFLALLAGAAAAVAVELVSKPAQQPEFLREKP